MKKDYYSILGVTKKASQAEIDKAFKKKVKQYHPDVCREKDANKKMEDVNEAYEAIGDSRKRQEYDEYLNSGYTSHSYQEYQQHAGSHHHGSHGGEQFFQFNDFGDIFRNFFGGHGHGDSGGYNQSSFQNSGNHQNDKVYNLNISVEDWFRGISTTIEYERIIKCKSCRRISGTCQTCKGRGFVSTMFQGRMACSRCNRGQVIQIVLCNERGCHSGTRIEISKTNIRIQEKSSISLSINGVGDYDINNDTYCALNINLVTKSSGQYQVSNNGDIVVTANIGANEFMMGSVINFKHLDNKMYQINVKPFSISTYTFNGKGCYGSKGSIGSLIVKTKVINNFENQSEIFKLIEKSKFKTVQDSLFIRQ